MSDSNVVADLSFHLTPKINQLYSPTEDAAVVVVPVGSVVVGAAAVTEVGRGLLGDHVRSVRRRNESNGKLWGV